jgi:hypothetical protein
MFLVEYQKKIQNSIFGYTGYVVGYVFPELSQK